MGSRTSVVDDDGNMTGDGSYEYVYDAENRLIVVRNIDPLSAACDTTIAITCGRGRGFDLGVGFGMLWVGGALFSGLWILTDEGE